MSSPSSKRRTGLAGCMDPGGKDTVRGMHPGAAILWTDATATDLQTLQESALESGSVVEHSTRASLPARIAHYLQRGPVVVLAGSDVDASIALRSGADEVLRAGELVRASVVASVERARLRYLARATPPVVDSDPGTDLISRALASELNAPLSRAASDCDVLWDALGRVLYATERLADWGSLNAPIEQLRELAALRASAPSSNELHARVDSLRSALARAGSLVRNFNELVVVADGSSSRLDEITERLVELLRDHVAVVGQLSLSLNRSETIVPRATVVQLVSGVLAHALAALHTDGRQSGGHIEVRVFEEEGAAVIEVYDDAPAPGAVPVGDMSPTLNRLQARARAAGGDLFLDDDEFGKTVRVVLPAGEVGYVDQPAMLRNDRLLH